jgi:DNA replication protein DnaC
MEAVDYGVTAEQLDYIRAEFPAFVAAERAPLAKHYMEGTRAAHLKMLISIPLEFGYDSRAGAMARDRELAEKEAASKLTTERARADRIIEARIPHDKLVPFDANRESSIKYASKLQQLCAKRCNWLFSGPTGSGKSMVAAQVLLYWMEQGASIYWLDVVGFYNLTLTAINSAADKETHREMKMRAMRASVLCVDDLGKEPLHTGDGKSLNHFGNIMHEISESRRATGRHNIVTSKYPVDELGQRLTVDIMTRFIGR